MREGVGPEVTGRLKRTYRCPSGSRGLQRLDRGPHIGIKPRAAGVEVRQDCGTHARVPELAYVFGYPGDGLAVALALEEFSDLVGHVDQSVRRHERSPGQWPQPYFVPDV